MPVRDLVRTRPQFALGSGVLDLVCFGDTRTCSWVLRRLFGITNLDPA